MLLPFVMAAAYALTTSGTCAAGHVLTSPSQCENAAAALSLGATTATLVQWSTEPSGCYYLSSSSSGSTSDVLYFNIASNTAVSCDTT